MMQCFMKTSASYATCSHYVFTVSNTSNLKRMLNLTTGLNNIVLGTCPPISKENRSIIRENYQFEVDNCVQFWPRLH